MLTGTRFHAVIFPSFAVGRVLFIFLPLIIRDEQQFLRMVLLPLLRNLRLSSVFLLFMLLPQEIT